MLYLLFVLTFLAGILFYGLSPRDDKLQLDVHQAEGMILTFVNQHQAAKDYMYTWLGAGQTNIQNGSDHLNSDFEDMMWGKGNIGGMKFDMCSGNTGVPGMDSCTDGASPVANQLSGFVSRAICVDKCTDAVVGGCTLNSEEKVLCTNAIPTGKTRRHYVVTYGGWQSLPGGYGTRPDWWPSMGQRMRKFESWRKAISKRTRNSVSCGFLSWNGQGDNPDNDTDWCIDNGETLYKRGTICQNPVPPILIRTVQEAYDSSHPQNYKALEDLLFCYSKFKQGLPGDYVSGTTFFYDGLSNQAPGEHATDASWKNLAGAEELNVTLTNMPYFETDDSLDTGITLGGRYTLTIILAYSANGTGFNIFRIPDDPSLTEEENRKRKIFQKTQTFEQFQTNFDGGTNIIADACNGATPGLGDGDATGIISWTFVVDGQDMEVYENATLTPFGTTPGTNRIVSTNGQNLILGFETPSST